MNESFLSQATLLYVEDDETTRNYMRQRLEKKVKKLFLAIFNRCCYAQIKWH